MLVLVVAVVVVVVVVLEVGDLVSGVGDLVSGVVVALTSMDGARWEVPSGCWVKSFHRVRHSSGEMLYLVAMTSVRKVDTDSSTREKSWPCNVDSMLSFSRGACNVDMYFFQGACSVLG